MNSQELYYLLCIYKEEVMNIILSGYGTMGKVVESLAIERGISIVGIFSQIEVENSPYHVYIFVCSCHQRRYS